MPFPDFTNDEQYLINCAKSTKANGPANAYMWGYVVAAAVLAGFGAYHGNVPMMLAAFAVVCGFRIYEEMFQSKWLPLWRSIIAKYEAAALGEVDRDGEPDS